MADAIKQFWNWWPSIRPKIEAAIDGAGFDDLLVREINDRVLAIRQGLDWELAPGIGAKHAFCISAKGDPEGRLLTETWRARGPAADATWEFHGSRRANPQRAQMAMEIEGTSFELKDFKVAMELDATRERIHGTYYHPAFRAIEDPKLRFTATYLTLDGALGEDEVERWLGVIETARAEPTNAQPLTDLLVAIEEVKKHATGERFIVCRGENDGKPAYAVVNLALKRIDHLLACMHCEIDIDVGEKDDKDMPTDEEADRLDAIEAELVKSLAGQAAYFGRETRRGRRVLHFFAPEDGPAQGTIERWQKAHAKRHMVTSWHRDPTWDVQRRFG